MRPKLAKIFFAIGLTSAMCAPSAPTATVSNPAANGIQNAPTAQAVPAAPMTNPPAFGLLPGQFAIRTMLRNTYLTARDGGHHSIDAVVTTATTPGPNEKFMIERMQPSYALIRAASGYYLSAVGGGGLGANYDETKILQTELQIPADDALFGVYTNIPGWGAFTIQTYKRNYLTALGGGGKATKAFHTDAVKPNTWEYFWVNKCGDLGSGYNYAIKPLNKGQPLTATQGGGAVKYAITAVGGATNTSRFRFDRQSNGTYSLQTSNGRNFVTAIQGGGLATGTKEWDNLVTDRTAVQAWETFRIVDRGNCTYTIQTSGNWFVGVGGNNSISTRISDPNAAPSIGYTAFFELAPFLW